MRIRCLRVGSEGFITFGGHVHCRCRASVCECEWVVLATELCLQRLFTARFSFPFFFFFSIICTVPAYRMDRTDYVHLYLASMVGARRLGTRGYWSSGRADRLSNLSMDVLCVRSLRFMVMVWFIGYHEMGETLERKGLVTKRMDCKGPRWMVRGTGTTFQIFWPCIRVTMVLYLSYGILVN